MLKIWGRASSINVQKVMWAVRELALPHERLEAGGQFGVVDTPEYIRMNPNRMVPVIEDGGFVLWESNAIVRYLAARYGAGSLWPTDPCVRGDSDRWMDWQTTEWQPSMLQAFLGLVRTPADQRDHAAVAASLTRANAKAMVLEQMLQGREFVAGSHFTMGDIVLGCAAHRWLGLPVGSPTDRPAVPALSAWYRRLMMRPAVQGVLTLPLK
ncbi:MAG TPA: glutathione S-transferase [Bordetella sp.]